MNPTLRKALILLFCLLSVACVLLGLSAAIYGDDPLWKASVRFIGAAGWIGWAFMLPAAREARA